MSPLAASWLEKIFPLGIPLPWRQLLSEKKRFLTAVAGITAAVTLMLFQVGIYDALFKTVVRPHEAMTGDLFLVSKSYSALADAGRFTRRRLHQSLADEGVESVASVYVSQSMWRNPETMELRAIFVLGCRPEEYAFVFPCIGRNPSVLASADQIFFDSASNSDFGPIAGLIQKRGFVETECGGARVQVIDLFKMGGTFSADGNILAGDGAFFRIVPEFPKEMISVGLVHLMPGQDRTAAAARIRAILPPDVHVLTRENFLQIERDYWARRTPIGFVISASLLVAVLVGAAIMYQILYTDVSDHLFEYATLKALGFSDAFFHRLIFQQSLILSATGFVPGLLLGGLLFFASRSLANLPTELSVARSILVLVTTTLMCCLGGYFAARKLKAADPADLF